MGLRVNKMKIELSPVCTYIVVGVILGIFVSLFFTLIFGTAGVVFLSLLCIGAVIFYTFNKENKDQKAGKKPDKQQNKQPEQFINWKSM
jgi:hypothetical protein